MKRHRSVLLGVFFILLASYCLADEGPTTDVVTQAISLPTRTLGSVAAIGDSITAAFNAAHSEFESCEYMDTPEYSFATNTTNNTTVSIVERAIAYKGGGVATWNFGSDGSRMAHGAEQAAAVKSWATDKARPLLITVFLGHNDICSGVRDKNPGSCDSLNRDPNNYCRTSIFAYEQQMRQMLDVLITIPDSQIAIIHPIRVSQICNFSNEKVVDAPWLTLRCTDLWSMPNLFGQDGVCPSLTSCTADRIADAYTTWVSYRDIGNKLVEEYNLYGTGETVPHNPTFNTGNVVRASNVFLVTTDVISNSKFKYRDGAGNVQLSVCECFHPSKYGQNLIAGSLWDGVACSSTTPCCYDNLPGDSSYNRGLCNTYTTSGSLNGLWYTEEDKTLAVIKAGFGEGVVTSVPAGIHCGSDCAESYSHGTAVTLTATPDADYIFTGWSEGCLGTVPQCTVTMTGDITVTATFERQLSVNEGTIGTELIIAGSGFGEKKGKVLIGGVAAKVAKGGWSSTRIACTIKRPPMPAETPHPVTVMANGSPISLGGTFTLRNPALPPDALTDTGGMYPEEIIVRGLFFGVKKGKVYIYDPVNDKKKKCRVTYWRMDPVTGESELWFTAPKPTKKFPAGPYTLQVVNKVGMATASSDFTIEPLP